MAGAPLSCSRSAASAGGRRGRGPAVAGSRETGSGGAAGGKGRRFRRSGRGRDGRQNAGRTGAPPAAGRGRRMREGLGSRRSGAVKARTGRRPLNAAERICGLLRAGGGLRRTEQPVDLADPPSRRRRSSFGAARSIAGSVNSISKSLLDSAVSGSMARGAVPSATTVSQCARGPPGSPGAPSAARQCHGSRSSSLSAAVPDVLTRRRRPVIPAWRREFVLHFI